MAPLSRLFLVVLYIPFLSVLCHRISSMYKPPASSYYDPPDTHNPYYTPYTPAYAPSYEYPKQPSTGYSDPPTSSLPKIIYPPVSYSPPYTSYKPVAYSPPYTSYKPVAYSPPYTSYKPAAYKPPAPYTPPAAYSPPAAYKPPAAYSSLEDYSPPAAYKPPAAYSSLEDYSPPADYSPPEDYSSTSSYPETTPQPYDVSLDDGYVYERNNDTPIFLPDTNWHLSKNYRQGTYKPVMSKSEFFMEREAAVIDLRKFTYEATVMDSTSPEGRLSTITALTDNRMHLYDDAMKREAVVEYIMAKYNMTNAYEMEGLHETEGSFKDSYDRCIKQTDVKDCNFDAKYRTYDGSCNNKKNPALGQCHTCYRRLLKAHYDDGVSKPRKSCTDKPLPNVRRISLSLGFLKKNYYSEKVTHLSMQWGQFIDHDISQTPTFTAGQAIINCCNLTAAQKEMKKECFACHVEKDDEFFGQHKKTCLNLVRSVPCRSNCLYGARQQTNQVSAFMDCSHIYGNNETEARSLRTFKAGSMRSFYHKTCGEILPSVDPKRGCFKLTEDEISQTPRCNFKGGDNRINQQPWLHSLHIVALRFHNLCAKRMEKYYPKGSDECIYQQCRRILEAVMSKITYHEYLYDLLGPHFLKFFKLEKTYGYTEYDPKVDPRIMGEFSAACFRYGHTCVDEHFSHIYKNGTDIKRPLNDYFFEIGGIYKGDHESNLAGLCHQRQTRVDPYISRTLTNHLYQQRHTLHGLDLPAINCMRGRGNGIAGYSYYLGYCYNRKITSFKDLEIVMSYKNWKKLEEIYECVEDIDLWVGGLAETHVPGGMIGYTFACVIGYQFFSLKYGDRYHFQHKAQAGSFQLEQVKAIQRYSAAHLFCNTCEHMAKLQMNPFRIPSKDNPLQPCNAYKEFPFELWKPKNGYCACNCTY